MKPHRPPRAAAAHEWLRADPSFAHLGEQTRTLAALQDAVRRCLPGMPLTVVAFQGGRLVVGAAHAAVAAKMRQVEPSLIAALTRSGWVVESVRFKSQWQAPETGPARALKPAPGASAIACVTALSEQVQHTQLRDALRRLAQRHGG